MLTCLQIIYVSIVAPVLCAAAFEWFLWLAAFCYCLVKAYRKSQHWSEKILAVLMIIFFVAFRCVSSIPWKGLSVWLTHFQRHIPPCHGRHSSSSRQNLAILSG